MIGLADLRNVTVSVTDRCNLRCAWCFKSSGGSPASAGLAEDEVRRVIDRIKPFAHTVTFTGGEPFVRRDIMSLLGYAASSLPRVTVTTNGVMVQDHQIPLLASYRVVMSVSLDGGEEFHDRLRGEGTYQAALRVVEALVDAGVEVNLQTTISAANLGQVDYLLGLAQTLGVHGINFMRMRALGRGVKFRSLVMSSDQVEGLARRICQAQERSDGPRVVLKDPLINTIRPKMVRMAEDQPHAISGGCRAGISYVYVDTDGGVQPCPYLKLQVGHVLDDDLEALWLNSPVLLNLRRRSQYQKCEPCGFWPICRGCRADAYHATGSYLGPDPGCWR
ncbi:MAG: radical SAM protein [Acetobacteraceae bacterium]|nr:radical SAM protein [Acetobacteraceae bacterium]